MGPWKVAELNLDLMFKMDALQSAIVIAYGRIFADGLRTVSRSKVPPDLRQTHDEIILLRNKRYAHHDSHPTINIATTVHDAGDRFIISQEMDFSVCIGAPQDWKPLFEWLRGHLHDRLRKQIARLEKKTGKKWDFPTSDPPDWLGIEGN